MLDMRLSTLQLVKLNPQCVEDASYARVIGKHHATDLVRSGYVWTLLGKSDLNGSRSPRNEVGKFSFSYSLKALVHLRSKLRFTSAKNV